MKIIKLIDFDGTPGKIRTCDPLIRSGFYSYSSRFTAISHSFITLDNIRL